MTHQRFQYQFPRPPLWNARFRILGLVLCLTAAGSLGALVLGAGPAGAKTRWTLVSPTKASGIGGMSATSCTSSTNCMTVGGGQAEVWNGSSWTIVPTPDTELPYNDLEAISCPDPNSCLAVGYAGSTNGPGSNDTLGEMWNGTDWALVSTPSPGTGLNALSGVSCTDPDFCMAVGFFNNGAGVANEQAMIEAWDGTSWTLAPSPDLGTGSSLSGVSCTATDNCVAVGEYDDVSYNSAITLIETWNGTEWSMVPSSVSGDLLGVSCPSSLACAAVGTSNRQGFAETWNGTSWTSIAAGGNYKAVASFLYGVSCGSADDCEAVGFYETAKTHIGGSFHEERTLINAGATTSASWFPTKSPNPPKASKMEAVNLNGVSCTTTNYCLAVGDDDLHDNGGPLAMVSGH